MKSRLFEFFHFDVLEANLRSGDQLSSQNFARFLAAYYLNYPLFAGFEETDELPYLLSWTDCEYNENPELSISRLEVANEVPPEYTAKFSLQLILDVCGLIEGVFFADHFNDARTALQVRLVADYTLGVDLFASYCQESLVSELLDRADTLSFVQPNDVLSSAAPALEALLQIDAVFGLSCHNKVERLALELAEDILSKLPLTVNIDEVKLPRPAIYAVATDAAVDNCEIVAWNKIHYFIHLFTTSLKLTNRLSSFVQFVVGSLLKHNTTHTELHLGISPTHMFGNDDVFTSESDFFRLLLLVLQMNARDLYTLSKINPEFALMGNWRAYMCLVNSDRDDPETLFRTWMSLAETAATEQIVEFLAYMKNDGSNEERYLPAFTEKTRKKWRNHFFAEKKANNTTEEVPTLYDVFSKFPIDVNTSKKLAFLNVSWKRFAKSESDLISVFLGLTPEEFTELQEPQKSEPIVSSNGNPLQRFIRAFLLEGNHDVKHLESESTLDAEHFASNSRHKTKRKNLKGDPTTIPAEEVRRRIRHEAEFMKSVIDERNATVGRRMRERISHMTGEMVRRNEATQIYNVHDSRDMAIESAYMTHRIRERLDEDLRKLEDGLRTIQEVIKDSEESEENEKSFRSPSNETAQPLPENIFRLDLTQLSPPPSVAGHIFVKHEQDFFDSEDSAPLSTIEVPFEQSSEHTAERSEESDRTQRSVERSAPESICASATRKFDSPAWLQLIPWRETKPSSVRILEMPKTEPLPRISTTARTSSVSVITPTKTHFDSGFIEAADERVVIIATQRRKFEYVNGMSQNEINSVVQLIKNN
ncbi:hypothetical protein QR680_002376 [Steinernema hermaphroditum]|uniref:Uncharacterized protein n=1 Tax=Steinernema hermaphroditum TaxID=289476 RepID=A0AA39H569_9BILA|nr:hypothetical protein QR680_002376 [Steinernema hermaphroditum]